MINSELLREASIISYPCLMVSKTDSQFIVLMATAKGEGTVLRQGGNSHEVGYSALNWSIDTLKPYQGSITLANN